MIMSTSVAVENQKFEKEEKDSSTPEDEKRMADLPPEVLTTVLENLIRNERRNNMLAYRLVNSQFKEIIDSLIEKKIISCQLPVFPEMKVLCGGGHDLYVRQSPPMFPFNSLLLSGNGDESRPNYFTYFFLNIRKKTIGLPEFMSKFGGNLTSFALHDVAVPGMNCLVTLLCSMPHLRRLSLRDVSLNDRILKRKVVLPTTLPPLPNLSILEVKAGHNCIPYIWLIASYADQLVRLNLETEEPLPAFQKGSQYSRPKGNTMYIATISDSAFANVTELKINRASKNFLRLSEFTKLKRLSVTGLANDYSRNLQDVTLFISKCRNSLKNLRLDVNWVVLMGQEANDHFLREGTYPPSTISGIESSCPTLKTLDIHYPSGIYYGTLISSFLALFPALETLYLLFYPAKHIATDDELKIVIKALRSGNQLNHADQIAALKTRLTSLDQAGEATLRVFIQQRSELRRNGHSVGIELLQEMHCFDSAACHEIDAIFKRLAALGERKQDVVVQLFLQVQGIWNTCPNLKVVSVSSGGKPEGDVCVIPRTNDDRIGGQV